MKGSRKKFIILTLVLLVASITAICIAISPGNKTDAIGETIPETIPETNSETEPEQIIDECVLYPEDCIIEEKFVSQIPFTYDELLQKSQLVVRGTIVEKSESFRVTREDGECGYNFTYYYLEPDEILRGNADESERITIRVEGGIVGKYVCRYRISPTLKIGEKVLAFLYKTNTIGGGYATKDDYYEFLGNDQGVFLLNGGSSDFNNKGSKDFSSEDMFEHYNDFFSEYDFNAIEMCENIKDFSEKNPVDYDWVARERKNYYEQGFLNGEISQEEYDDFLRQCETYATID